MRALPFLAIVGIVLVVFGPTVASGHLLATGDAVAYYVPARAIAADAWRHGELPAWNPFQFGGTPLLAALQAGVFFPGNLAYLLLPPVAAHNATVIGTYVAGGLAVHWLARVLGLGGLPALLAGCAFALSGYMVAHLEHTTMLHAACVLPLLLGAVERHIQVGGRLWALAFAALLALQWLAGYPQTTVSGGLFVAAYALYRLRSVPPGERARRLGALGTAALLGTGLAAIQLVPLQDWLAQSDRATLSYEELTSHSLPLRQLVTMWFPFLYGSVPSALCPVPHWGAGPWYDELVGYMGLVPLGLAAAAASAWRRHPEVRPWVVWAGLALLLALGSATPLYELWHRAPVLSMLRVPGRHLLELDLALALLAGFGLELWTTRPTSEAQRLARIAFGAVAVPVVLTLVGLALLRDPLVARWQPYVSGVDLRDALDWRQPGLWVPLAWAGAFGAVLALARRVPAASLLLVLAAGDQAAFAWGQGWRQLAPRPEPRLGASLPRPMPPGRVLTVPASAYPYRDVAAVSRLRHPGWGLLWGERHVGGMEAFISRRQHDWLGAMGVSGTIGDAGFWEPGHHALDLLGGQTLRLDPEAQREPGWGARLAPPRWQRLGPGTYRNTRALPPTWRPDRAEVRDEAFIRRRVLSDPTFDPRGLALVEPGTPVPTAVSGGRASVVRPAHGRIVVDTDGAAAGLVVVSEAHEAGWRAWAEDGRLLPVCRVDGLLLGVLVPPGPWRVELRYAPPRWPLAWGVTALCALLAALWALVPRLRRRAG